MDTGRKTVRQTKTHFKMYKSKHGWLVAGITLLTISGAGFATGNEVHAATTDQPDTATVDTTQTNAATETKPSNSAAPDAQTKTDTNSAEDATKAVVSSNVASDSATQTNQSASTSATDTNNSTSADNAVAKAADAETENANTNAPVETNTPSQASTVKSTPTAPSSTTAAKSAQTTDAHVSTETATSPQTRTRVDAVARTLTTPTVQVGANFDGTSSSVSDSYTDGKPDNKTPAMHLVNLSVSKLQKNDVLKISVPDFKTISSAPNVAGMTKNLDSTGRTLTYTVSDTSAVVAGIPVYITSVNMASGSYTGDLTVAVNGTTLATLGLTAQYTKRAISPDVWITPYDYNVNSTQQSTVQLNSNFASKIQVNNNYNSNAPTLASDYNSLQVTILVPAGYVLNQSMTTAYNNKAMSVANAWVATQASAGADVVFSANLGAYAGAQTIEKIFYMVGALTTGSGTVSGATNATFNISTIYGDYAAVANNKFAVTLTNETTPLTVAISNSQLVYVAPSDVNVFNVNQGALLVSATNDQVDQATMTIGVPAGTTSTGLKLTLADKATALGENAVLSALDASGNVLATVKSADLAADSNENMLWLPAVASPIAGYKVVVNNLLNNSFGATSIAPILTTNAAPNGTVTTVIPVAYTVDGQNYTTSDYKIQLTSDHTIYPGSTTYPHLQSNDNSTVAFQPGDKLTSANYGQKGTYTYLVYLFDDWKKVSSYTYFDGTTVVYLPLPNNSTVISVSPDKGTTYSNVTQITENGVSYARVVIPAGTSAQPSTNANYSEQNTFSKVSLLVTLNADVTAADTISLPDASKTWAFMGVTGNQVDDASWVANGGQVWTIAQVRDAGYSLIADQLADAGYTQAYVADKFNSFNSTDFPLMVPTTFVTDQAIKGDTDAQYVSGDGTNGIANFYPSTGASTGTIRDYVGNGTQSPVAGFTSLVTLPKQVAGDAYSLNLQGAISVPAGMIITYSTSKITGTDGSALTTAQLSNFVTANQITDWRQVQSILITAATLKPSELQQIIIPFTVADYTSEAATANASSYTYVDGGESIIGGSTVLLPTRIAEAQRQVTVHYVDADNNELSMTNTIAADAGSTLTLTAATVTGYAPTQATQTYVVGTDATQDVYFTYDKVALNVNVNYINQATGTQIKSESVAAKIGDVIDLTGSTYTQLAGYAANANNATSYTVTAALAQSVSLYFTPQSTQLTVHYLSTSGAKLLPDKTLAGVYQGSTYLLTAPAITGYTPSKASQNFTVNGTNQECTFTYSPQTVTYTVNYVDLSGQPVHAADQLSMAYDATQDVTALLIDGYKLKTGETATHTVNYAADNGAYTFVYVGTHDVTQTINYVDADGKKVAEPSVQTFSLTQNDDGTWPSVSTKSVISPHIADMAPTTMTVAATPITNTSGDRIINVVYFPVQTGSGVQDYGKAFTRTINYVDVNGQSVAQSVTQTGSVTRRNAGTWVPANLDAVTSPRVTGMITNQLIVAATVLDENSADSVVNVIYYTPQLDSGIHDYSKTVTRTIKYVDANGSKVADDVVQAVTLTKRNNGEWSAAKFDAVNSPALSGKTTTVKAVAGAAVTPDSTDSTVVVTYQDAQLGGGIHDYSKTFTRTIKFVDATGVEVAPSVTQTATVSQRNAGPWSTASWIAVSSPRVAGMVPLQQTVAAAAVTTDSADTTVIVQYQNIALDAGIHDYRKTVTRTIQYVDINGKKVAASTPQTVTITKRNDGTWSAASFAAVDAPRVNGLVAGQKSVGVAAVTADSQNSVVTITYYAPQVGAGIRNLSKTVTRTINFVDAAGNQLADPVVQRVTLKRSDVGTQQGGWTTGVWTAVAAKTIDDYTTASGNVAAQLVTDADADVTVNVMYARINQPSTTPDNGGSSNSGDTGTTPDAGGNTIGGNTDTTAPNSEAGGTTTTLPATDGNTSGGSHGATTPGGNKASTAGSTNKQQQLPATDGQTTSQAPLSRSVVADNHELPITGGMNATAKVLPQTGDAAGNKLSVLGLLGLALSGISTLAFKNKHKED
ncbi:MAG: MucBP domain-containing protein [Lacticaseibacillus songhuajiangensis]|jgi:LPXTG-motif cell wall-anchored protein|nr:MucBP domain-containing protein [Lacticaseibacillus songhuajiangensis]